MPLERDLDGRPGEWSFDDDVAGGFDEMLDRSIPQLDVMRGAVSSLVTVATNAVPGDVLDLGCSRGGAIADYLPRIASRARVYGYEVSAPMLKAAKERFADDERVTIHEVDLRQPLPPLSRPLAAVTAVLTVQFVPIEHRQRLIADCHRLLAPGGLLVLVEKVLAATALLNEIEVALYYERKRQTGYSEEEIQRKRLALEGILVPVTADWNVQMLHQAGFGAVDGFWRWMNFAGWVAVA
jgi:tRNA (cmo5U34)-methyltransferase